MSHGLDLPQQNPFVYGSGDPMNIVDLTGRHSGDKALAVIGGADAAVGLGCAVAGAATLGTGVAACGIIAASIGAEVGITSLFKAFFRLTIMTPPGRRPEMRRISIIAGVACLLLIGEAMAVLRVHPCSSESCLSAWR